MFVSMRLCNEDPRLPRDPLGGLSLNPKILQGKINPASRTSVCHYNYHCDNPPSLNVIDASDKVYLNCIILCYVM